MDQLGIILLIWFLGSLLLLFGIEAVAVVTKRPTISARVRAIGRGATIVIILTSITVGYLLAHFWDNFISGC